MVYTYFFKMITHIVILSGLRLTTDSIILHKTEWLIPPFCRRNIIFFMLYKEGGPFLVG